MSNALIGMSSGVMLLKHLGLKSREGLVFSPDWEMLYLSGTVVDVVEAEEEQPSSTGRSLKTVKTLKRLSLVPTLEFHFEHVNRTNMRRILLSPAPTLMELGQVQMPTVLDPSVDTAFKATLFPYQGVTKEQVATLSHFARLYILD